jgi:transmembrane sensor
MNSEAREQAAAWLVEFRSESPDAATRVRFADWLRASPAHVSAYLKLATLWEDVAHLASQVGPDALIELARAEEGNVIPLSAASEIGMVDSQPQSTASGPHRKRTLHLAAAAAIAAIAAGGALWWTTERNVYTTALGEQRTLALADGSTVELNALSSIRVRFTKGERRVDLFSGQALFNVTHNRMRPFVVVAGATRVADVGTEFAVARSATSTIVTVVEGVVLVSTPESATQAGASAAMPTIEVTAGEEITIAPHVVTRPHKTNVATATAWTQQQLIFDSTPLSEAAAAFNRFNGRRLRVEGTALQDLHVSGTFPARDPDSLARFVLFLRDQPGIEVQESDNEIIVKPK